MWTSTTRAWSQADHDPSRLRSTMQGLGRRRDQSAQSLTVPDTSIATPRSFRTTLIKGREGSSKRAGGVVNCRDDEPFAPHLRPRFRFQVALLESARLVPAGPGRAGVLVEPAGRSVRRRRRPGPRPAVRRCCRRACRRPAPDQTERTCRSAAAARRPATTGREGSAVRPAGAAVASRQQYLGVTRGRWTPAVITSGPDLTVT